MKNIYISGPITDSKTGQPREGWQKDFLDAEARLRKMGFSVVNPVTIARFVEKNFAMNNEKFGTRQRPDRPDYILACLIRMGVEYDLGSLHGVYLIGDADECRQSDGVQMELHWANVLRVPVFADFRSGNEIWTDSFCLKSERNIEGLLSECLEDTTDKK